MDQNATTPTAPPSGAVPPKKYIRTFHSDMESMKKGATPDLTPLKEKPLPPKAAEAVPEPEEPSVPLPAFPIPFSSMIPQVPVRAPVPAAPVPEPAPPPPPPPKPRPIEVPKPTPLKTYSGDFSDRMKETRASTATVLAAEQDSAPLSALEPATSSKSNMLYSIAGGILLLAGGFGAYVAYVKYLSASAPVVLVPTARAPIFVNEREQVSGTGTALLQEVQQMTARPLTAGSVRLLYLENATTTSVFSALQLPAPNVLLRNIIAAPSMAGVVNVGGTQSPFFILAVTSYSDTFAGMLSWEPVMPRDLAKFFPPYTAVTAEVATSTPATATTTATTTPKAQVATPKTPTAPAVFIDAAVANHDVRVYRDAAGRDVLLYGYWDQNTLIIARDAEAFSELLGRLATSRAQN